MDLVVDHHHRPGVGQVRPPTTGADTHPAWFHNLVAHPTVHVRRWEDGALAEYDARAWLLEDDERTRAWDWVVERSPGFGDYATKTDRVIPVVALLPER